MNSRFLDYAVDLLKKIDIEQNENIEKASELIAESLIKGGILQTNGSGHSYAGAKEIVERAGGLMQTKLIADPSLGMFENIEGVGSILLQKSDIRPEDVVLLISVSGRNPLAIEIALHAKKIGAKVIAVTSLEMSTSNKSRHSSGKRLYEIADVVLDIMAPNGDACMKVEGIKENVCPISSVTTTAIIEATILRAMEKMVDKGHAPDVRVSRNIDGGLEHNIAIQNKYADRIFRL